MRFPIWAALGLLAAEYISFNVGFDSLPLRGRPDGWAVAARLGWLAGLVVSSAVGAALVVHADRERIRQLLVARRLDATALACLAAHALSVALLWHLSARVFAPAGPPPGSPAPWLSLWALVALAAATFALAAAIPRERLRPTARAVWPGFIAGAAIGVTAWVAGQASAMLWWPLGPLTLGATGLVLNVVLHDPVFDPAQALIGSERFQVLVTPECSGFEGVGLMAVFVGSYLVLARRHVRFPQALLLLPLGLTAAWVANVARLVLLVILGSAVSEELALGGFHARAGWLLFCGLALALVLLVQRTRFFAREPAAGGLDHSTAAYLLPFLALVGTALVTGLVTTNLDLLYGARVFATILPLVALRRFYRDISWSWSWGAVWAGIAAAVAFVALASRPDPELAQAWQEEWWRLPTWGRASWLFVRAVGSILIVPLAEELAFRGYLLRRLIAHEFESVPPGRFSLWALLVSSAAFGAVHANWPGATVAGLLFGVAQIRGGSVGHAVLAHVVSNAAVAVCVLGFGLWWLWM